LGSRAYPPRLSPYEAAASEPEEDMLPVFVLVVFAQVVFG
jgi:hypothetical protein